MGDKPAFYITTAISYPNGKPHIGHAYEAIATDSLARFKRLDGYDVYFLTGVDEHGLKMQQTAEAEGVTPKELSDQNSMFFLEMVKALNCSNTDFIRTSETRHKEACQQIWQKMLDKGDIYLGSYEGWYSVRDEAFYAEKETTLNKENVRVGPQGTPVEWTEEKTYFFKLSAYQQPLLDYFQKFPEFIGPQSRRNEVIRFVEGGLNDLSISRTTFDWGVPVPDDNKHIMYVWVDALTNYLTGVDYPDEGSALYQKFWPANLHIIGKDIIRFHSVYWPAFLLSAGLPLPKRVFAHGFLFNQGEKMSKSVGNVIDPFSLINHYGLDQIRYFLLRDVPFGQDGNYSHELIVNRINADLSNDLGNLAQRSLSMIFKNLEGQLIKPNAYSAEDHQLLKEAEQLLDTLRHQMDAQAIHKSLENIWRLVANANKYFANQEPWTLKKTDPDRMAAVLYVTAETLRRIAILTQPYIPDSANKLLDALSVDKNERDFMHCSSEFQLADHLKIDKPIPIFPRYVESEANDAH